MENEISVNVVKIPNGTYAVEAIYSEQELEEYKGNPFIEALPLPNYDSSFIIDQLAYYPKYSEQERQLDRNYRLNCVSRLFRYFQPLDKHLLIERMFSQTIRAGYLCRNPIQTKHVEALQKGYQSLKSGEKFKYNLESFNAVHGFSIIGVSGIGKTTAVEKILSTYSQVIIHSNYKDILPSVYQVVYLKLDCPFDGSLKALCRMFFQELDRLLGTEYYRLYGRSKYSIDEMMISMTQLVRLHGIGCVVLDEIQCLSMSKSGGAEKMLNFFMSLTNILGIPFILIGTMKALSVLQLDFRQARRGAGQGNIIWERMSNDSMWNLLIEGMWRYQWTSNEIELTPEISNALYDESQGIIDIAIKIYAMAQMNAISSGSETITAHDIHTIAKEQLSLVQPMVNALRSGMISEIAKFDDIRPFDISSFLNKKIEEVQFQEAILSSKKAEKEKRQKETEDIIQSSTLKLIDLGINPKKAQNLVKKVLKTKVDSSSVNDVVKLAILLSMEDQELNADSKSTKLDCDDLRNLLTENKEDFYEKLKENGYVAKISYSDCEVKIC